ncbi:uncharacterized protein LOC114735922 isoform X2 [Neltuma alba]|uniref:uncharacterized protein LOC114735922 isoform X2 n=1 Tax=Neltuma alba TaxID=207710 RepID=UPI0010A56BA6|nr:uncharacterized protein LOC114735922 isoform X2 [Prosopis alba]
MARGSSSSPKVATVSQVCETGCSSRLYRILNFREGQATKNLVSNSRRSNIHAIEHGNPGSRPDVLTIVDEKNSQNHTKVSFKRKYYFGCKSISCVKNDQVAIVHRGNEATKKVVARNFINGKYLCKDGAISQPYQFLDALQILYSNKELFLRLAQEQNSLSGKEQYQAGQKMLTRSSFESRWMNSQRSHATQCEAPYAGCHYPLHSHGTHNYNVPSGEHSYFQFSHAKRKLTHALGVKKKGHRLGTANKRTHKFPYSCQGIEAGGDEAEGLESVRRKSASGVHSAFAKVGKLSLDSKKREKMKIRAFMLCRGKNDASVHGCCGRNITQGSVSPSLQNIHTTHVEATKNLSEILNCRIEEQHNNEPPGDVVKTVKDELHCFSKNVEMNPPDNGYAYNGIPTGSEKFIKSGHELHSKGSRHMDVPSDQDSKDMDSPTQSSDVDSTSAGNGSDMDSPNVAEDPSSSPEVASSSSSSCQTVKDAMDITNMIDDHLNADSATGQVVREEVTNPPTVASQPVELPIQPVNDNSGDHHSADLPRCSSDLANNLITSIESDCDREILQALSLKWDELVMNCELPDQLMHPSPLEELKGFMHKLSGSAILFDYVMEVFMDTYQQLCRFPRHISIGKPNVQSYVLKRMMVDEVKEFIDLHHHQRHQPPRTLEQILEKDLARRRSWLNVQVDIDDTVTEVQEDVLQELILEIISGMDTTEV